MTLFDAYDLIALWERDRAGLPVTEKALLLLALARPDASHEALAAMSFGACDRALFELRAALFGDELRALSSCSACDEQLEVGVNIGELLAAVAPAPAATHASYTAGDLDLRFRLPTIEDAIAAAPVAEAVALRQSLVRRCILAANRDGVTMAPDELDELDEEVIAGVAAAMERLDPLAEVRLKLACTACDNAQSMLLEIASYLWAELMNEAERLLDDVFGLALQYGWREADILAMSGKRRQYYLDGKPT